MTEMSIRRSYVTRAGFISAISSPLNVLVGSTCDRRIRLALAIGGLLLLPVSPARAGVVLDLGAPGASNNFVTVDTVLVDGPGESTRKLVAATRTDGKMFLNLFDANHQGVFAGASQVLGSMNVGQPHLATDCDSCASGNTALVFDDLGGVTPPSVYWAQFNPNTQFAAGFVNAQPYGPALIAGLGSDVTKTTIDGQDQFLLTAFLTDLSVNPPEAAYQANTISSTPAIERDIAQITGPLTSPQTAVASRFGGGAVVAVTTSTGLDFHRVSPSGEVSLITSLAETPVPAAAYYLAADPLGDYAFAAFATSPGFGSDARIAAIDLTSNQVTSVTTINVPGSNTGVADLKVTSQGHPQVTLSSMTPMTTNTNTYLQGMVNANGALIPDGAALVVNDQDPMGNEIGVNVFSSLVVHPEDETRHVTYVSNGTLRVASFPAATDFGGSLPNGYDGLNQPSGTPLNLAGVVLNTGSAPNASAFFAPNPLDPNDNVLSLLMPNPGTAKLTIDGALTIVEMPDFSEFRMQVDVLADAVGKSIDAQVTIRDAFDPGTSVPLDLVGDCTSQTGNYQSCEFTASIDAATRDLLNSIDELLTSTEFTITVEDDPQFWFNDLRFDLVASQPAVAGDYNGNGVADAADYVVWRILRGQSGDGLAADGTGPSGVPDGSVDDLDYEYWKVHFGDTAGAGGASTSAGPLSPAVPEPSTLALLTFVVAGLYLQRNRTAPLVSILVAK